MKKFINPVSIVVLTLVLTFAYCMCCNASIADKMQADIDKSEAYLDSLDCIMPFVDTVGETDEYCFLCEAYEEFEDAKADLDNKRMVKAYNKYNRYYNLVVKQAHEVMLSIKQRRAE